MTTLNELVSEVENIMYLSNDKIERAVTSMITKTKNYVDSNKLQSLVVGVSGGLDSAVVSAILQEYNIGVPLIGISIPMNSSNAHKEQAQWVGDKYCTAFEEFNGWERSSVLGEQLHETIEYTLATTGYLASQEAGFDVDGFPHAILQGNMKARLRMMTLYDLARKTNGMVLSTDNLSEYLAGFWTINGDVGDWGIIQNVWKGFELPQIAKHIGVRDDIITQKPSDGLSVTADDTDEAQLGMNYKEFDTILSIYTGRMDISKHKQADEKLTQIIIDGDAADREKVRSAISRYKGTNFKRVGTVNLTRDQLYREGV